MLTKRGATGKHGKADSHKKSISDRQKQEKVTTRGQCFLVSLKAQKQSFCHITIAVASMQSVDLSLITISISNENDICQNDVKSSFKKQLIKFVNLTDDRVFYSNLLKNKQIISIISGYTLEKSAVFYSHNINTVFILL